jgi:hypothetical protein
MIGRNLGYEDDDVEDALKAFFARPQSMCVSAVLVADS